VNDQTRQDGIGVGWIILLVLLYIIFNPLPGPIDDIAVTLFGGHRALKRL
jgi:hypothetical protein